VGGTVGESVVGYGEGSSVVGDGDGDTVGSSVVGGNDGEDVGKEDGEGVGWCVGIVVLTQQIETFCWTIPSSDQTHDL